MVHLYIDSGQQLGNIWNKPLHTIRGYPGETASQRDSEISGKYSCNSVSGEYKGIFILDDLCTRGATVSEIARALKTQLKNIPIWGLALAKNDRKRYMHDKGKDISNDHIPAAYAKKWDNA